MQRMLTRGMDSVICDTCNHNAGESGSHMLYMMTKGAAGHLESTDETVTQILDQVVKRDMPSQKGTESREQLLV